MSRTVRIAAALVLCWAAPVTLQHVHNSAAWQSVLMFALYLPWPSIEAANVASHICEALLGVFLGGAYSTLLALSARLSALASSAILSVAVSIGFELLIGYSPEFLVGHVMMIAAFFVGGWLISALVLSLRRRKNLSRHAAGAGV